MADASACLERSIPIHIYGYNNVHDVIVYMVVKDPQSECRQPCHHFQKSPFWSVYTETQPRIQSLLQTIFCPKNPLLCGVITTI